jgi:cell division protein FtsL
VLCAVSIFGLGRVAVAVQATETSFDAGRLREDIKAERLHGDLLEVDKSALTTPSRIEAIAGSTMRMADADDVAYLALPEKEAVPTGAASDPLAADDTSSGEGGVVAALMELAAEEAQVLLVGDVGLASPR